MNVELINVEMDSTKPHGTAWTAVARVTIGSETREFPANFLWMQDGKIAWNVPSGIATRYPTGCKVHNFGLMVYVTANGTTAELVAWRGWARRMPTVVGFYDAPANAASEKYRR